MDEAEKIDNLLKELMGHFTALFCLSSVVK